MHADFGARFAGGVVRVDDGMGVSACVAQLLADILGAQVHRPASHETTAFGAAYLAVLAAGPYPAPDVFAAGWAAERRFEPSMPAEERSQQISEMTWGGPAVGVAPLKVRARSSWT